MINLAYKMYKITFIQIQLIFKFYNHSLIKPSSNLNISVDNISVYKIYFKPNQISKPPTMQNQKFKYYCYLCLKHFTPEIEVYSCTLCDSQAIEKTEHDQSQQFQVYQLNNPSKTHQHLGNLDNIVCPQTQTQPRTVVSIVSTISHSLGDIREGSFLGNLLRQFLRDGNQLTAATQQQIQNLEHVSRVKECSVCQTVDQSEEMTEQKPQKQKEAGFKLPCGHDFHESCIRPWFQKTNTCPVCRRAIVRSA